MIDANSQFFAILTQVGEAKQANADALGRPWLITDMGVGDANDTDPVPDRLQTRLINEWRRRPLNQLKVDPVNAAVIIAEQIIPADEGGKWIREIGLYDADGDLVAVANCAPSFKPVLSQGSGRTQIVRMNLIVSSAGNITLKIDPAVVLATREFVEQRILEELYKLDSKQSVRVATTTSITLAGLQTVDGVALLAGDRVLVKNQAAGKDNGLYIAAAATWSRAPDADSNAKVTSALLVSVEQGATLADTRWQLITDGAIIVGTTALTFQNVTHGFAPINAAVLIDPKANTPPQFDSSKALATTEFVQRALGNKRRTTAIIGSGTIAATEMGADIVVSAAANALLRMPSLASVADGASVRLINLGAGRVNFSTANDGDCFIGAFNTSGTATTFSLEFGDEVSITRYSNLWLVIGSGSHAQIRGINGYKKHSGGIIEQWGIWTSQAEPGAASAVTFPLAFTGGVLSLQFTTISPSPSNVVAWLDNNASLTGFVGRSNGVTTPIYWRALGY
ncbi:phage tail protein [Pseudomonas fluorescens]|uniref:Phage tail protein n=1 Tax=Pseudomonas fluorescens TaxID=294 RepID=A0A327N321_PSEFL|nr:phage tail protein [Pseudomonas fluorescens]RAI69285.1 phage tail protein [Pseudomonas fluorescens]